MPKFVDVRDYQISIAEFSEEEHLRSRATYDSVSYTELESFFEYLLQELQEMSLSEAYRKENASEFIRAHDVLMYNLAKTGFVIEHSQ